MREPCEGKLSSTVLRREGTRKGSDLSNTVGKIKSNRRIYKKSTKRRYDRRPNKYERIYEPF
jgi:hypothetical protein